MILLVSRVGMYASSQGQPVQSMNRVTESGDNRVVESTDNRVTEGT